MSKDKDKLENLGDKLKVFLGKHLIATIDCIGGLVAIATFIPIFFVEVLWQSIFISVSINIFTSLLVLTFVDRIIDSQRKKEDEAKRRSDEKKKILRYYKALQHDLRAYIVEFNQLTTPYDKRKGCDKDKLPFQIETFNTNFNMQDLIDFDMLDMTIYGRYTKKAILTFSELQKNLYESFDRYVKDIDFEFFHDIEKDILNIISSKEFPVSLENLLILIDPKMSNSKQIIQMIKDEIKSYNGNPLDDINSGKYNGNIFINILSLYVFLILISQDLKNFIDDIHKLQEEP